MHRNSIQSWSAQSDALPTWRDGLGGSDRTYLIIAVPHQSRKGYQAIVYGRYGGGSGKIKFYPNPEALGIDRRSLMAMGMSGMLDRPEEPYTRFIASLTQVKQLLQGLEPEVWACCPVDQLEDALVKRLGRDTSLQRAPRDHLHELHDPVKVEAVQDQGGIAVAKTEDDPGPALLKFVQTVLADQTGKAEDEFKPEATLLDLMGSLDTVEAMMQVKDHLSIEIPDGSFETCKTVQDLLTEIGKNDLWRGKVLEYVKTKIDVPA